MIETQAAGAVGAPTRPAVIDCDIHNVVPSHHALMPFLSEHWRDYVSQTSFKGPVDTPYPPTAPTSARPGSAPPDGGPAGSSLPLVREQALDAWGTEIGILNCAYAVESVHNPDAAAAMASAVNDWQVAEWLDKEPRLRASLVVPVQQPAMAAKEIERLGDHPGIVQVFLPVHAKELYGSRVYYPLFDAIAAHDLVVGLHFGGAPGYPPTASGWPSYYIEEYVGAASDFPVPDPQYDRRGAVRSLPEPAGGADRGRLHLDAVADVADGQGMEGPAPRGALEPDAAVRVCPSAHALDAPTARRAAGRGGDA